MGGGNSGIVLLYHDIIDAERTGKTGHVSNGSWRYKVTPKRFERHLDQLSSLDCQAGNLIENYSRNNQIYLTFDDGGNSIAEYAAPRLNQYNMHGHIFIITNKIGANGYLSADQIKQLSEDGHHIGSHTCSHQNLKTMEQDERLRELRHSKSVIEKILSEECNSLSVPRGGVNRTILSDAFDVGYDYVFTSEPKRIVDPPIPKAILGRWNVWHNTTTDEIKRIVNGDKIYCSKLKARHRFLHMVKTTIGHEQFVNIRNKLLFNNT
jgi:peptidoglycan/xylan/chitin deacetylase (PgdA/CDA1 family)